MPRKNPDDIKFRAGRQEPRPISDQIRRLRNFQFFDNSQNRGPDSRMSTADLDTRARHNELTSIGREPGLAGPFDSVGRRDDFGVGKYRVEPAQPGSGFRRRVRNKSYINPDDLTPQERAQLRIQIDRNRIADDRSAAYGASAAAEDEFAREKELQRQREDLRDFTLDERKQDDLVEDRRNADIIAREEEEGRNRRAAAAAKQSARTKEAAAQRSRRSDPTLLYDDMAETRSRDVATAAKTSLARLSQDGKDVPRAITKRHYDATSAVMDAADAQGADPVAAATDAIDDFEAHERARAKWIKSGKIDSKLSNNAAIDLVRTGKDLAEFGYPVDDRFMDELIEHVRGKIDNPLLF